MSVPKQPTSVFPLRSFASLSYLSQNIAFLRNTCYFFFKKVFIKPKPDALIGGTHPLLPPEMYILLCPCVCLLCVSMCVHCVRGHWCCSFQGWKHQQPTGAFPAGRVHSRRQPVTNLLLFSPLSPFPPSLFNLPPRPGPPPALAGAALPPGVAAAGGRETGTGGRGIRREKCFCSASRGRMFPKPTKQLPPPSKNKQTKN